MHLAQRMVFLYKQLQHAQGSLQLYKADQVQPQLELLLSKQNSLIRKLLSNIS